MFQLGPYKFSTTDVDRTLRQADTLFDLLPGAEQGPTWPAAAARAAALKAVETHQDDPGAALTGWWGHWRQGMEDLRSAGLFGPTAAGEVAGLFLGSGGVPKLPQRRVRVGWDGVEGDRQAVRKHHGRPWQALCLWSVEVIEQLVADGHPVYPGSAGENVTVSGLDWARVVPGVRLQVGTVLAEVAAYAEPCKTIAGSFADRRFDRIHHRRGAVSRVYATVLQPGSIEVGDPITLEPEGSSAGR